MQRRDFLKGTAAAAIGTFLPPISVPLGAQTHPAWRIAVHGSAGGKIQTALAATLGDRLRVEFMPSGPDALARLMDGAVEAALVPTSLLARLSPALGLFGGMPFGPGPAALACWLSTSQGRRMWNRAHAGGHLVGLPIALEPAGCLLNGPGGAYPRSLRDLRGRTVASAGPVAELWQALGAVPVPPDDPAELADPVSPGMSPPGTGPRRGFGPRTHLLELAFRPETMAALPPDPRHLLASLLPLHIGQPVPMKVLPAEIQVAAGEAAAQIRASLAHSSDPLIRTLSGELSRLREPAEDLAGSWPWTAGTDAEILV